MGGFQGEKKQISLLDGRNVKEFVAMFYPLQFKGQNSTPRKSDLVGVWWSSKILHFRKYPMRFWCKASPQHMLKNTTLQDVMKIVLIGNLSINQLRNIS